MDIPSTKFMPSLNKSTSLQRLYLCHLWLYNTFFWNFRKYTEQQFFKTSTSSISLKIIFRNSNVYSKCIISLLSFWNSCTNEIEQLAGIKIESGNETFSEKHSRAYQTCKMESFCEISYLLKTGKYWQSSKINSDFRTI